MWFFDGEFHVDERAAAVQRTCPNCSNDSKFQLLWSKQGLSLGIPIVMLFTDKARICTHKCYYLSCQICQYRERIDKNIALGLIAEGRAR